MHQHIPIPSADCHHGPIPAHADRCKRPLQCTLPGNLCAKQAIRHSTDTKSAMRTCVSNNKTTFMQHDRLSWLQQLCKIVQCADRHACAPLCVACCPTWLERLSVQASSPSSPQLMSRLSSLGAKVQPVTIFCRGHSTEQQQEPSPAALKLLQGLLTADTVGGSQTHNLLGQVQAMSCSCCRCSSVAHPVYVILLWPLVLELCNVPDHQLPAALGPTQQ